MSFFPPLSHVLTQTHITFHYPLPPFPPSLSFAEPPAGVGASLIGISLCTLEAVEAARKARMKPAARGAQTEFLLKQFLGTCLQHHMFWSTAYNMGVVSIPHLRTDTDITKYNA